MKIINNTGCTIHTLREEAKATFIGGRGSYIYILKAFDRGCKEVLMNKDSTVKLASHVSIIDYIILDFMADGYATLQCDAS